MNKKMSVGQKGPGCGKRLRTVRKWDSDEREGWDYKKKENEVRTGGKKVKKYSRKDIPGFSTLHRVGVGQVRDSAEKNVVPSVEVQWKAILTDSAFH